jgi:hypothetical protein
MKGSQMQYKLKHTFMTFNGPCPLKVSNIPAATAIPVFITSIREIPLVHSPQNTTKFIHLFI